MDFNNLNLAQSLGLLTTGAGLLEGQGLGSAVRSGLGTFSGISQINQLEEERRRREALRLAQDRLATAAQMGGVDMAGNPVDMTGLAFAAAPKLAAQQILAQQLTPPKVYGDPTKGMYTYEVNPATGNRELQQIVAPQGLGQGAFSGTSVPAQDSNILLSIGPRVAKNDPTLTELERNAYNLSYARMSQPQRYQVPDGQGGMTMVEQPPVDLSTFPAPRGMGGLPVSSPSPQVPSDQKQTQPQKLGGGTVIGRKPSTQEIKNIQSIKNANKMLGNLNNYRLSLREAGGFDQVMGAVGLPSDRATDLSAKAEALRLDLKNLYELGALVGGDFQILDNLLTNPNTVAGIGVEVFGSLETQLDSLENQLRADMQTKGYQLAGTEQSPIIAKTQQEFDDAPIGTYVLMVDEETGQRRLVFKR